MPKNETGYENPEILIPLETVVVYPLKHKMTSYNLNEVFV